MGRRRQSLFSARTVLTLVVAVLVLGAGVSAAVIVGGGTGSAGLPVGAGFGTSLGFSPTHARLLSRAQYLALAEQGIAKTSMWWDPKLHWYRDYLGDHQKDPLESLWDTISMFELLDEVTIAQPSGNNRSAVAAYAAYYAHYWNPNLQPTPGYAPHPGQRGKHQPTWYDDAGWLGLAFLDADKATGTHRYLTDAERAVAFIKAGGWDAKHGGGMWWDTQHPWHSGEALAADTDLAARLYQVTSKAQYLSSAETWMAWANKHLRHKNGVYIPTSTIPYGSETYTGSGPGSSQPVNLRGPHSTVPAACRKAKSIRPCVARLCKSDKKLCLRTLFHQVGTPTTPSNPNPPKNANPKSVLMPHDGEGAMLSAMVTLYQATHHRSWLVEAERFAPNIIKWLEPFDDGPQYDGILLRGFVALYAQDHNPRWYDFVTSMASVILRTARTAPGVYLKAWGGGASTRSLTRPAAN